MVDLISIVPHQLGGAYIDQYCLIQINSNVGATGSIQFIIQSGGRLVSELNNPDDKLHVLGGNIQVGKTEQSGYETIIR